MTERRLPDPYEKIVQMAEADMARQRLELKVKPKVTRKPITSIVFHQGYKRSGKEKR